MKNFVSVHVDAEKGEGVDLAKRYGAHAFPTLVIADAAGDEVDRIIGFRPPDEFVKEIERISRGEGTIPALRKAVAASPDDLALAVDLGQKLVPGSPDEGFAMLEGVLDRAKGKPGDLEARALVVYGMAALRAKGREEKALAALERAVTEYPASPAVQPALRPLVFSKAQKDPLGALAILDRIRKASKEGRLDADAETMEATLYVRLAGQALERAAAAAGDDAQRLAGLAQLAWRQRISSPSSASWAKKAMDKGVKTPVLLDAYANLLLNSQGDLDAAEAAANEAIGSAATAVQKAEYEATLARVKAVKEARAKSSKTAPVPVKVPGAKGVVPGAPVAPPPEKPADPKAAK